MREQCEEEKRSHFHAVVDRLASKRSETLAFQAALTEEKNRKEQFAKSLLRMDLERVRSEKDNLVQRNRQLVQRVRESKSTIPPHKREPAYPLTQVWQ